MVPGVRNCVTNTRYNTVYNSYAKTLDPITELHFAPGESGTTKHIVLTTTQPDLFLDNASHQDPASMMNSDPGMVLSIGLEPNGRRDS